MGEPDDMCRRLTTEIPWHMVDRPVTAKSHLALCGYRSIAARASVA